MDQPIEVIPEGLYCYTYSDVDCSDDQRLSMCPYWDIDDKRESQNNGYCHFLGEGDWDVEGLSLLWDQCKECGQNFGDELNEKGET